MVNIEEYQKHLNIGKYGDELSVYCDGYATVQDAIYEIAHNNVDVYTCDLMNFLVEHQDEVEDAINSIGWEEIGATLCDAAQVAEENVLSEELSNHVDDIITYYVLDQLKFKGLTEVDEEWLDNTVDELDENSTIDDLDGRVEEYCEEYLPSVDEKSVDANERSEEENKDCQETEKDDPER